MLSETKSPAASPFPSDVLATCASTTRLETAVATGDATSVIAHLLELSQGGAATDVLAAPVRTGMATVAAGFQKGTLFLPQLVKCVGAVRVASTWLEAYEKAHSEALRDSSSAVTTAAASSSSSSLSMAASLPSPLTALQPFQCLLPRATIVLANVRGDVHEVGKLLVGSVLRCNNYNVVDLGGTVDAGTIVSAATEHRADIVGLSGMAAPSLREMVAVAARMHAKGVEVPLLIGGAATSRTHTAVHIAPQYASMDHPVIHVLDASRSVIVVDKLLGGDCDDDFVGDLMDQYDELSEDHHASLADDANMPVDLSTARNGRFLIDWDAAPPTALAPGNLGRRPVRRWTIEELRERIDWKPFFQVWEIRGRYPHHRFPGILDDARVGEAARQLYADAQDMLDDLCMNDLLWVTGMQAVYEAHGSGDDVLVYGSDNGGIVDIHGERCSGTRGRRGINKLGTEGGGQEVVVVGSDCGGAGGEIRGIRAEAANGLSHSSSASTSNERNTDDICCGTASSVSAACIDAVDGSRRVPSARLCMLRQQTRKGVEGASERTVGADGADGAGASSRIGDSYCCLSDFVAPQESGRVDHIGMYAVCVHGCDVQVDRWKAEHSVYRQIMIQALCDRLAEACGKATYEMLYDDAFGQGGEERCGMSTAPGYPSQPDHSEKETLWGLLGDAAEVGFELMPNSYAMVPGSSVCGFVFSHPLARNFSVRSIGEDQVRDYAHRKGVDISAAAVSLNSVYHQLPDDPSAKEE